MSALTGPPRTVAISGSFRKHYGVIQDVIAALEHHGWTVLSPARSRVIDGTADFPVLESDGRATIAEIEQRHLDAIASADALYVVDPGGYIGISTAMEIGWALAYGVPIFLQSPTEEETISVLCSVCAAPHLLDGALSTATQNPTLSIRRSASLPQLQDYIRRVVVARGFADETPRDILLLLLEEVGELAKALRKVGGLKIDVRDSRACAAAPELADVLIYLLDLANALSVDLVGALIAKEEINRTRQWA